MAATHANTAAMNITKNGWTLKHCPATSNLPTAMSQGAWDSLCKATMQREIAPSLSGNEKSIKSLCSICRGKTPPLKLKIIDLKKENDMQPKKDKRGPCESCGDLLQLKLSNGMQVCGKCSTIYSNTRNWLPIVEASLIYFYPERYGDISQIGEAVKGVVDAKTDAVFQRISAAVGYQGQDPDGLATRVESLQRLPEVQTLKNQLDVERRLSRDREKNYEELSQAYDEYRKNNEGTETQLQYLSEGYAAIRSALGCTDPTFDIVEAVGELAQTLDRYKKRCEGLEKDIIRKDNLLQGSIDAVMYGSESTEMPYKPMVPEHNNLDKHLLNLAKVFLKNPNAGCDEVADWIDVVREAA